MIRLDVKSDKMDAALSQLSTMSSEAKRAMNRAVRDTERRAKNVVAKLVAEEYTISAAAVKRPGNATLTVRRSDKGVALVYRGRTLTLHNFRYLPKSRSKRNRAVSAEVKNSGMKSLGSHAYIGGTGAQGAGKIGSIPFKRTGGAKVVASKGRYAGIVKRGPRKGQPLLREPVMPVYTLSVPQMVGNEKVSEAALNELDEYMYERFTHHYAFFTQQKGGNK